MARCLFLPATLWKQTPLHFTPTGLLIGKQESALFPGFAILTVSYLVDESKWTILYCCVLGN